MFMCVCMCACICVHIYVHVCNWKNKLPPKTTHNANCRHISARIILKIISFSIFLFAENSQTQNKLQQGKFGKYRKQRIVFEPTQLEILEEAFASNAYPSAAKFEFISKLTMIDEAKLRVWFQNRRARCRKSAKNSSLFQAA